MNLNDPELIAFLAGSVRLALPIAFAAVGELVSERAGVLNVGLEGTMLTGAFAGALGAHETGSPMLGLLCGMLAAVAFAAFQGGFMISLGANQLVLGIAASTFALGLTTFLSRQLLPQDKTGALPSFDPVEIPLLHEIPLIGPALFAQSTLAYIGLALVALTLWVLTRTGWGLAIRAAGDDARSADRAGSPVNLVRWIAVLWAGLMAGVGGVFLALADIQGFTENMTAGRGYLALGAVIAGSWIGWRVVLACLVFGAAIALQFQASGLGLEMPVALLVMAPYVIAVIAVASLAGRSRMPADLTIPFSRGR